VINTADLVERLRAFFTRDPSVILAYLFGSHAKGRSMSESDLDIAVYLADTKEESRLWSEVSALCECDPDLVVLNGAPATLLSAVLKTGVVLADKDRGLSLDLYLAASAEAEDFAEFATDFARIARRSRSLLPEDRTRLVRRIAFLREELAELPRFADVGRDEYADSRSRRREMERWAENVANATIDVAKIVLGSRPMPVPGSYREALRDLGRMAALSEADCSRLEGLARLRNLLAHEYLDLLYERIRFLIDELPPVCERLLAYVQHIVDEVPGSG